MQLNIHTQTPKIKKMDVNSTIVMTIPNQRKAKTQTQSK